MNFFVCCFIKSKEVVTVEFNCIDSAATQFTPETPEVFCELKHFPPPFRRHCGEQIMSEFTFFMNYPFKPV